jgi:hypothetical protein
MCKIYKICCVLHMIQHFQMKKMTQNYKRTKLEAYDAQVIYMLKLEHLIGRTSKFFWNTRKRNAHYIKTGATRTYLLYRCKEEQVYRFNHISFRALAEYLTKDFTDSLLPYAMMTLEELYNIF